MKLRSLLLAGAAAVLIPVGGVVLTQSVLHSTAIAQSNPAAGDQSKPARGDRGKGRWGEKWQEQLNLSADQKAQIKQIRDQEKADSASLRQQIKAAFEKQQSLMTGNASDDQIRQQRNEMQALRQQAEDRRFNTMLKIRQILTPEQRTKAAQLMKEHRGRRHGGWGGGKEARGMMQGGDRQGF